MQAQPISFVVERSADDSRLLKEKFSRLMVLFRDPVTSDHSRIINIGDQAIPLLIAELRASDDPGFRQRIGYALAHLANADALLYFRSLLAGEMKHDQRMVLTGLFFMIQRAQSRNEALELLLDALKHPTNTQLRREAAELLAKVHDPHVKQGFEAAINDDDATTATTAARYLAAYEGRSLADWFAEAAEHPTPARYLAARSFIRELEDTWHVHKGDLPEAAWTDFPLDRQRTAQFRKTLRAWERWSRQHQRSSNHFFDPDRVGWPKQGTHGPPVEATSAKATEETDEPASDRGGSTERPTDSQAGSTLSLCVIPNKVAVDRHSRQITDDSIRQAKQSLAADGPETLGAGESGYWWAKVDCQMPPEAVVATWQDKQYVLLPNMWPRAVMHTRKRYPQWGLLSTKVVTDDQGRAAVELELDELGEQRRSQAEQLVGLSLAVVVDDKVISVRKTQSKPSKKVIIGGLTTERAEALAKSLLIGMPTV